MKKYMLLLLALALLFCAAASAETAVVEGAAKEFEVTLVVPEGYAKTESKTGNVNYIYLETESADAPDYTITIAYSEAYAGLTLNELSDADKQLLLETMDDDFVEPDVTSLTTEHGTEVYMLNEAAKDSASSFASGFSVYKGYFVQIYAAKPNYQRIEQADIDLAIKILSDMWFVDK